jgi:hypothetical protein
MVMYYAISDVTLIWHLKAPRYAPSTSMASMAHLESMPEDISIEKTKYSRRCECKL